MKRVFLIMLLAIALPVSSGADQSLPFLYSRSSVVIARKHLPPAPPVLPWQAKMADENPNIKFSVEVRDAMALYQHEGWFNLSSPAENAGMLMVFNTPSIAPITKTTQYAPMDILLIDPEGKIIQIIPNMALSKLEQDITPETPVLAFLFLKGGVCEKFSISPGDMVDYSAFKKPPKVLTNPPAAGKSPAPDIPAESPIKE